MAKMTPKTYFNNIRDMARYEGYAYALWQFQNKPFPEAAITVQERMATLRDALKKRGVLRRG